MNPGPAGNTMDALGKVARPVAPRRDPASHLWAANTHGAPVHGAQGLRSLSVLPLARPLLSGA